MKPDFPLMAITFVAFDLETTGLTPVVDRIVEIGAVRFRGVETHDTSKKRGSRDANPFQIVERTSPIHRSIHRFTKGNSREIASQAGREEL